MVRGGGQRPPALLSWSPGWRPALAPLGGGEHPLQMDDIDVIWSRGGTVASSPPVAFSWQTAYAREHPRLQVVWCRRLLWLL